ncbi:MAG TPA: Cys-tRNA(Pro) deacylase [Clostridia bacterium]|nr:Cys-tRNA(Pro) deacylase [Clostridia bacterium]
MGKVKKTNAMRLLEQESVTYEYKTYSTRDGQNDGVSVAKKVNEPLERVFKTLVVISDERNIYVCMVPVNEHLSLKKVADVFNEKNIEMLDLKKLQSKTGYVKGGCSPIAMKNDYPTVIHESALDKETIVFSAGKVGMQLKMNINDLIDTIDAKVRDIIQ